MRCATDPYSARGNFGGKTLLHYAVAAGKLEAVEYLLSKGASPEAFNEHSPTPLHLAAEHPGPDSAKIVQALLRAGGHADPMGWEGPSPLQSAILHANVPVISVLLEAGATENLYTDAGLGRIDDLRRRLGADPSLALRPDGAGRGPLCYAAANHQLEAAGLLLVSGAKDLPGDDGPSLALTWAIGARNVAMVNLLFDHASNANGGPDWYERYVHQVVEEPSPESAQILKALLAHQANPNAENIRGYRPLHLLGLRETGTARDDFELLVGAGADVNAPIGFDRSPCGPPGDESTHGTPLHVASSAGSVEMVNLLLAAGPNGAC